MSGTLPPEIVSLIAQLESSSAEAHALLASASPEQLTRRPAPGKWAAAECLEHLAVSNARYVVVIRKILAKTSPTEGAPRFTHTLFGRLWKTMMEPPVRVRLPAPKLFRPPVEMRRLEEIVAAFDSAQHDLIALLHEAAPFDFSAVKMYSPVSKRLKLNLWDGFTLIAAHERRHLWQARNVLRQKVDGRR